MAYQDRNCLVLKSVNYKDADKIFTLYSDKEGKFSAIARGVRKISSKRAGSLDRLNLVRLCYYQSPGGHKTITEVKALSSFRRIKDDPGLISTAYKITSFLLRELEEGAGDPRLFSVLKRTLQLLDEGKVSSSAAYAFFVLNFMGALGYSLSLDKCQVCDSKLSKDWKTCGFNFDKGGLVCGSCLTFEPELSLQAAALMNKLVSLNKADFRFFTKKSPYLNEVTDFLSEYIDFKLS